MNKEWEVKKLGDILKFEYGKPLSDSKRKPDGKYPVYGANGEKGKTDEYYHDKQSIIVGRKGSAGEINLTESRFWPLDVTYFVTFNDINYDLKFLFYLLRNLNLTKLAKGVKPGINRNEVYAISKPVPSLLTQRRIVAILDTAFNTIAKAKENTGKNLQNAQELFDSYLQKIFANPREEWEVKKLGEICIIKPPKNEARSQLSPSDTVSFAPMESLGINRKYLNTTKTKTLKEVEGSYTYFAEGDVLLAKITPCFENGKLGIADKLDNGIGFGSSEYIVFRTPEALNREYLYYFLSRERFREEGARIMSGAVGHKRITKEFIENYLIPVPPLSDQHAIVTKFDALSSETKNLEAIYRNKLAELDELKRSILQKAFEGELTN